MLSKATLLGRVGNMREQVTQNGKTLLTVSLATSRKYTDSHGQKQEATSWHNVNFFGKLAEIAGTYLQVGNLVYVEGEIRNQKYEKDGQTRYVYSVTANEMKLLPQGQKQDGYSQNQNTHQEQSHVNTSSLHQDFLDDDIPF